MAANKQVQHQSCDFHASQSSPARDWDCIWFVCVLIVVPKSGKTLLCANLLMLRRLSTSHLAGGISLGSGQA